MTERPPQGSAPDGPADAPDGGFTLAAVDIGTNSVHMVVARIGGDGRIDIIDREKEMVRLGHGAGDMKELDPAAIERGVAALGRFRSVAEAHGAELAAVATSAVREAENRREFLDRAEADAGVTVDVISGLEEARLIHLGVLQSLPLFDDRLLLIDIGGGSTEVLLGHRGDVVLSRSFRLGAIRLTERFFSKASIKAKHIARCRQHVEQLFSSFAREVRGSGFDTVVGASGTIETIVEMAVAARGASAAGADVKTRNAERVTRDEVRAAVELLIDTPDIDKRAKLPGVELKRADIILAGAIILEQFMETFGADELVFSDYALREGVLLDRAQRRNGITTHRLRDLRRESVEHLLEAHDEHPDHSRETARLSLRLFDELAGPMGLDDADRELLEAAALLCNVGVSIAHSGHHKHSYYVIRNSEHLSGFTDREIELIAQIARYHRKSQPKAKHVEWASLPKRDRSRVFDLAAIVRVGVALDRSHGRRIADVTASVTKKAAEISLVPRPADAIDVHLELHSAELRRKMLEDALGRPVSFVVGDPTP